MKKGILTISTLLLASVLLYLLASVSKYGNNFDSSNAELLRIQSASNAVEYTSSGIVRVVASEAVNISVTGKNVSFKENLGLPSDYARDLNRFAIFASGHGGNANVSVNLTEALRPKFYIQPQGIFMDHTTGLVNFTAANTTQSGGDISGYEMKVTVSQPSIRLNWTQSSTVAQASPDALYYKITVNGTNNSATDSLYLNRSAGSTLQVLNAQNSTLALISFRPVACASVAYSVPLRLETIIALKNSSFVELGTNIINVGVGGQLLGSGKVVLVES